MKFEETEVFSIDEIKLENEKIRRLFLDENQKPVNHILSSDLLAKEGNRLMELLPCPFCGSNNIHNNGIFCACNECKSTSHSCNWNTRHSPWISVKDRLPPIHEEVLIYNPSIDPSMLESDYSVGYLESDDNFYFNNYQDEIECCSSEYITHWMPLPKPPKETE